MKRVTIRLSHDIAPALDREAKRLGASRSHIAREAIESHLARGRNAPRAFPLASLGRSGYPTTARDIDDILKREWTLERLRGSD